MHTMRIGLLGVGLMVVGWGCAQSKRPDPSASGADSVIAGDADSTDSFSPGTPVLLADLPAAIASVQCSYDSLCRGPVALRELESDVCETRRAGRFANRELPYFAAAIDAGSLVYNAEYVAQCLESQRAQGCAGLTRKHLAVCNLAFAGQLDIGAQCVLDEECRGATFCDYSSTCPGRCQAELNLGQECGRDADCQPGAWCNDRDTQAVCATFVGAGTACEGTTGTYCSKDLLCRDTDANPQTASVCVEIGNLPGVALGNVCVPNQEFCEPGAFCVLTHVADAHTYVCEGPSTAGGACHRGLQGMFDPCPLGEYCLVPLGTTEGTCTTMPGANQACADTVRNCGPGNTCDLDTDTCVNLVANQSGCASAAACYSQNCEQSVCQPPVVCN